MDGVRKMQPAWPWQPGKQHVTLLRTSSAYATRCFYFFTTCLIQSVLETFVLKGRQSSSLLFLRTLSALWDSICAAFWGAGRLLGGVVNGTEFNMVALVPSAVLSEATASVQPRGSAVCFVPPCGGSAPHLTRIGPGQEIHK